MDEKIKSTKPFIFVLFLVGVTVRSAESLSSAIPLGTSTKRANSKRANHGRSRIFQDAVLSVSFWLRSFPVCGWWTRSLSSVSGHPTCWRCFRGWLMRLLWAYEHDFAAISPFLSERLAPSAATRAGLSASRGSPAGALGDLMVTARASPPCTSPRTSYTSRSKHPIRFPGDFAGPSHRAPSISFGAPSVDRMSIAASRDGLTSSEDEGAVGLPPSGVVATAAPDPELTPMLARAAVGIGLEVNRPPSPKPSQLDYWFLGAWRGSQPRPAPVPFFPEVHEELTKSWMALSRPEATRPPPPSSLPSTAEWPGGTRAFPRWRERSRCTCAHETPPLGGTVRVSRPRPVSWQLLSRPKLIALRARQPPPCMPWLSCSFTKPRRSNRCTRVVPTRGWCRSCAQWLTSLHERRKSQHSPSVRRCPPWWSRSAISGSTWQRWRMSTTHAFLTPHLPGRAVRRHRRGLCPAVLGGTAAAPRRDAPSTAAPGVRPQSARCRGHPLASFRAAPPQAKSIPRLARRASRRRAAPQRPSQAPSRPGSRQSGPDAGNPEMLEFALSQETARTAPLLPPVEGREENLPFLFRHFLKKEQFPFPPGSQVHGTTVCDALLPHSRPRPILPVARVRFGGDIPPHAPLAFGEDASERTAFCTIHPYSLSLHHHRYVDCAVGAACTASGGVAQAAQPVSLAQAHNSTRLRDSVHQATSQF